MKFDEMNPAPPVTRTRFVIRGTACRCRDKGDAGFACVPDRRTILSRSRAEHPPQVASELFVDRVQGAALHVALNPPEVLPDQREDESLDAEHEEHEHAA